MSPWFIHVHVVHSKATVHVVTMVHTCSTCTCTIQQKLIAVIHVHQQSLHTLHSTCTCT